MILFLLYQALVKKNDVPNLQGKHLIIPGMGMILLLGAQMVAFRQIHALFFQSASASAAASSTNLFFLSMPAENYSKNSRSLSTLSPAPLENNDGSSSSSIPGQPENNNKSNPYPGAEELSSKKISSNHSSALSFLSLLATGGDADAKKEHYLGNNIRSSSGSWGLTSTAQNSLVPKEWGRIVHDSISLTAHSLSRLSISLWKNQKNDKAIVSIKNATMFRLENQPTNIQSEKDATETAESIPRVSKAPIPHNEPR